jgi:hypothetical protein
MAVQIKAAVSHEIDALQNERGHYASYLYLQFFTGGRYQGQVSPGFTP